MSVTTMSLCAGILYEDEHCLAVVKRAGQFVQGDWAPPGEQTLEQEVRQHLRPDDPAGVYLGIVHRLDRPVSGVLLWAKTEKSARRLSQQFERRQAEKEYWAIAEARVEIPEAQGRWEDWLTRPGKDGVVCAVEARSKGSRPAWTRYSLGDAQGLPAGCVWLRLFPETGRTHQLRIQSACRGWPILGDADYGARLAFGPGIALHARRLRVRHPIRQTPLELTAALPDSWAEHGIQIAGTDR
ncbi:MAG: RluA family pseudouridine synthase [Isosphaeraceae bacterium]